MKFQPQAAAADLDLMATCSKSGIIVDVRAGWKRRGQAGWCEPGSVWSRVGMVPTLHIFRKGFVSYYFIV
jgi:hypothetical protein